eukprot:TRINITY_DN58_c2_g1_i2.p1 TRINITY_DN58_c2_g1~~TRINITY_DN58_c2_g1_i2.p1  ORF type:complete len:102 (+),score=3.35 TRINITY_DN58_c2_g1_i2:114-419(+)
MFSNAGQTSGLAVVLRKAATCFALLCIIFSISSAQTWQLTAVPTGSGSSQSVLEPFNRPIAAGYVLSASIDTTLVHGGVPLSLDYYPHIYKTCNHHHIYHA